MKNRTKVILAICLAVIVLAGLGVGIWALVNNSNKVQVPNVVGQTKEKASVILDKVGLKSMVSMEFGDNTKPAGTVINQNPVAGSMLEKGKAVKVGVSKGIPLVTVPNVVGMTQAKAEAALTAVGLKLGAVSKAYSSSVPTGKVVSQDLAAGQQFTKGIQVRLVLSEGAKPATTKTPATSGTKVVPNVVGMDETKATNLLQAQGFVVVGKVNPDKATPPKYAETVQTETPSAGMIAAVGSTVTIVVYVPGYYDGPPDIYVH